MPTYLRQKRDTCYAVAEIGPTEVLRPMLMTSGFEDDEAQIAQRTVMALNACVGVSSTRLASLARPSAAVRLPEILEVLDALVKKDPALIHKILLSIRGKNAARS